MTDETPAKYRSAYGDEHRKQSTKPWFVELMRVARRESPADKALGNPLGDHVVGGQFLSAEQRGYLKALKFIEAAADFVEEKKEVVSDYKESSV